MLKSLQLLLLLLLVNAHQAGALFDSISSAWNDAVDTVGKGSEQFASSGKSVGGLLGSYRQWAESAVETPISYFTAAAPSLSAVTTSKESIQKAMESVSSNINAGYEHIRNGKIGEVSSSIASTIESKFESIKKDYDSKEDGYFWEMATEYGRDVVTKLEEGSQLAGGAIVGSVYTAWSYAVDTAGSEPKEAVARDKSMQKSLDNWEQWVRFVENTPIPNILSQATSTAEEAVTYVKESTQLLFSENADSFPFQKTKETISSYVYSGYEKVRNGELGETSATLISKSLEKVSDLEISQLTGGAIVGSMYNTWNYAVDLVGRRSNLLIIRDKSAVSSLGNYRSWVRIDAPHGNVNYHHLNINPAVTGVADPHTWLPKPVALGAAGIGRVMSYVNKVAPVLFVANVAYDAKQVIDTYQKDENEGMAAAANTVGRYAMSGTGSSVGASIGTAIFPGVGTLVGGIVGGIGGSTVSSVCEPIVHDYFT